MSSWETIKSWVRRNAQRYIYAPIPKERTDVDYDDAPLVAEQHYFRLWLPEMFLAEDRRWFRDFHPAVNAAVQLNFGGRQAAFTTVSRAPKEALTKGIFQNFDLTPLLPFRGGDVEIEASLVALQGKDHLGAVLGVLQSFSSLIAAPLGEALQIADKVSNGLAALLDATDGNVHMALHQQWTGGDTSPLRPGYVAIVMTTADRLDKDRLSVRDNQLHYQASGDAAPKPLEGVDSMLIRVEGRRERDDWRLFAPIQGSLDKAIDAILRLDEDDARMHETNALGLALTSPDLTRIDRRRVAMAIRAELAELRGDSTTTRSISRSGESLPRPLALSPGESSSEAVDLGSIMKRRAMSIDEAAAMPEMTAAEIFSR